MSSEVETWVERADGTRTEGRIIKGIFTQRIEKINEPDVYVGVTAFIFDEPLHVENGETLVIRSPITGV